MVQGGLVKGRFVCLVAAVVLLLALTPAASASVYFGATISGETYGQTGNAPTNEAAWNLFERHAGKRVAILNQGQSWCAFDKAEVNATAARGAIPLVTMGLGNEMTLADVASGSQDAAIKKWAQEAKAWGKPFLFAPWWEMNGAWYAWGRSPDFVAAWRRFHDLVAAAGATNVTWTWVVNGIWSDPASDPSPYFPGDAYVDWTGIDSYNWGRNPAQPDRWESPAQTLDPTLEIVRELAPAKPVMIVESASTEYGGDKADWIREMLTAYLPHHPEIAAYLWFNWNFPKNGLRHDWQIESSPPAQQEFRREIQGSLFVGAPASLPALTKVGPPPATAGDPPQAADLSAAAEMASGADVAVAPDGAATVVWSSRAGGAFSVWMRRIAADGTPALAAMQLSASGQDALTPQVAVAPDGTATVAWTRSDGSNFLVQARRVDPNGIPEDSTKNLSTTGRDAFEPRVSVGLDGVSTVVWKKFDGFHYLVQERRIAADGTREDSSHTLSESKQDAVEPQVAAGPDGSATVVWSRYDGADQIVQARRIGADDAPEEAIRNLSASGESAIEPQVAIGPDGTATAVWTRFDGANWIIQSQRLSPTGAPEGPPRDLSAAGRGAAEPQLAIGANGAVTAVWDRFDGSQFVVQARRLAPTGAPAAAAQTLSASGRDAAEPAIAIAPGGVATVLWSRFDGAELVVQRRDLGPGGELTPTEDLSAAGRGASHPAVAWGSDGTLALAWQRFNGAGDVVQARTVPLAPPPPPPPPPPNQPPSSSSPGGSVAAGIDSSFRIRRIILNRRRGTARLEVEVSAPGRLRLGGAVPRDRDLETAGVVALRVVPRRGQQRVLNRKGVLRLRLTVTYEPRNGSPGSRRLSLRLRSVARGG